MVGRWISFRDKLFVSGSVHVWHLCHEFLFLWGKEVFFQKFAPLDVGHCGNCTCTAMKGHDEGRYNGCGDAGSYPCFLFTSLRDFSCIYIFKYIYAIIGEIATKHSRFCKVKRKLFHQNCSFMEDGAAFGLRYPEFECSPGQLTWQWIIHRLKMYSISCWKLWFSSVMLVFRGVTFTVPKV